MKKAHRHGEKIIGIAWYRKEQWSLLRQVSKNPEKLESTHEEWLNNAIESKKTLEKAGVSVKEVDIDIENIIKWCKERHRAIDSKSISEYVALRLRASDKLN